MTRTSPFARALVVAAVAGSLATPLALSSCSAFETNLQDTEVDYEDTARQNFDKGEEAMTNKRFQEAVKFFEHTKNKYPYSKYAVLAELRIADAHFDREKWIEAADAYRIFVRFHPRHEKVPYATYRVAESFFREIDQDVWFMPTAIEKDQTAAKDAIRAFDEYLARFPKDENVPEAQRLRIEARSRLADTDLYAADFYVEREKWQGALWRFERVATDFADTPKAPYALLRAARIAEEELNNAGEAQRFYERLAREFPTSTEAQQVRANPSPTAAAVFGAASPAAAQSSPSPPNGPLSPSGDEKTNEAAPTS